MIAPKAADDPSSSGVDVMADRWLSVEEIAEYLGVSKDTVYTWITKRRMPAHRIGRLWKFKADEIDSWVKSGGAAESVAGTRGENGNGSLEKLDYPSKVEDRKGVS